MIDLSGVRHDFVLDGVKILKEEWIECNIRNTLVPLYDNEDSVCGIEYNGTAYYFLKNLQGDIIAIVNKDAETVARYSYDAWGSCTNAVTYTELTNGVDIATINPFRYRGYYYDVEAGLYYLQSRYYDASIGRFVNSDDPLYLLIVSNLQQYNICCYCENNIINKIDYTGYASTTYGGITCTSASKGFWVKMHYKFLMKTFCVKYAKHIISVWGKKKKYCGMNATRIAVEIFGHAVFFVIGVILGIVSISFQMIAQGKKYLAKVVPTILGVASGKVANYLYAKTEKIDVNSNEKWYRMAFFYVIWAFFN